MVSLLIKPLIKNNPIFPIVPERWALIDNTVLSNIRCGYYISTMGRVYSAFSSKLLNPVQHHSGYIIVSLYDTYGHSHSVLLHRIVMIMFHPIENMPEMQVNHKFPLKTDNCECNLEWATPKENIQHAIKNNLRASNGECSIYGYIQCGSNNPMISITEEMAEEICKLLMDETNQLVEIANTVGCNNSIVWSIYHGSTWQHIAVKYSFPNRYPMSLNKMHTACAMMQNTKGRYSSHADLYRDICNIIGETYNGRMNAILRRLYNRTRYTEITDKYDY